MTTIHPGISVKFVPSDNFGIDGLTWNGSVLWKIREGSVDMTLPYFAMGHNRAHLKSVMSYSEVTYDYAVKIFSTKSNLKLYGLVRRPIGIWAVMFLCVGLSLIWKFLVKRRQEKENYGQSSTELSHRWSSRSQREFPIFLKKRFDERYEIVISFWFGILLSLLSAYIVTIFVADNSPHSLVYDDASAVRQIAAGKYRPIFISSSLQHYFYSAHPDLSSSVSYNPPIVIGSVEKAAKTVHEDLETNSVKNILVFPSTYRREIEHVACDLLMFREYASEPGYRTAYIRENFTLKLNRAHSAMLDRNLEYYNKLYYPHKFCPIHRDEETIFPGRVSLDSLAGLFVMFILLQISSVFYFFLEIAYVLCSRRSYRL